MVIFCPNFSTNSEISAVKAFELHQRAKRSFPNASGT